MNLFPRLKRTMKKMIRPMRSSMDSIIPRNQPQLPTSAEAKAETVIMEVIITTLKKMMMNST